MAASAGVTFAQARRAALALADVTEGPYYGRPAFFRSGKFFLAYRADLEVLVAKITFEDRDLLIAARPAVFFITDHYLNYPSVLLRLGAARLSEVEELIRNAWELAAPKAKARRRTR